MNSDKVFAIIIAGILFYKTLELVVVRLKLRQAHVRGERAPGGKNPRVLELFRGAVRMLDSEFYFLTMIYFIGLAALLGLSYLLLPYEPTIGQRSYRTVFVVSLLTIISSIYVSVLNVVTEKFRTLLEEYS